MSKREEIREWISERTWRTYDGMEKFLAPETIDDLLQYLHSQDVVIKVDRELPKVIICEAMSKLGGDYKKIVWEYAQETMRDSGWAAVEELI